jgi:hypothetical protein
VARLVEQKVFHGKKTGRSSSTQLKHSSCWV